MKKKLKGRTQKKIAENINNKVDDNSGDVSVQSLPDKLRLRRNNGKPVVLRIILLPKIHQ
jgi:hypothetical protein